MRTISIERQDNGNFRVFTDTFTATNIPDLADVEKELAMLLSETPRAYVVCGEGVDLDVDAIRKRANAERKHRKAVAKQRGGAFTLPADKLRIGLESVKHCVLNNETRKNLTGVHLRVKAGEAICEATDGHTLARYTFEAFNVPDLDVILSTAKVDAMLKECRKAGLGNVALFIPEDGEGMEKAGFIRGVFPNVDPVIPDDVEQTQRLTVPVAPLYSRLKLVASMEPERIKPCKFKAEGGTVTMESELREDGHMHCGLPEGNWSGCDLTLGFNAPYVMRAIRAVGETACLMFASGKNASLRPILIRGADVPGLVQVVMPLRIEW